MPRSYPPEFRRKVLDLLKSGRTVRQVAADLQISDQRSTSGNLVLVWDNDRRHLSRGARVYTINGVTPET